MQPLDGIRVVDLTSVVVGPVCTVRLVSYGAEVIKIEAPEGDLMRTLGGASPSGAGSGAYLHLNRGKRAACLDLKQPAAREALLKLIDTADVFVSNMRSSALRRLGLDADALRTTRPRLVHCTITGFGPGGAYRDRPAYDSVLQGVSGIAGLGLRRDGVPSYAPLLLCDHVAGEITAGAIMAALMRRERTGEGAAVEVPMFETMAAFVLQEHMARATFEPPVGPSGDVRLLDPGSRPLNTADGWISLTVNTDAQVAAFLKVIGRPELADDPRFRTVADRVRNVADWFAIRDAALLERTTADWLAAFGAADVPAMPAHTLESLMEDPHLADVGLAAEEDHPVEGRVRALRPTILTDGLPGPAGAPAQARGWDTVGVLRDAGLTGKEIEALAATGAARMHEQSKGEG